MMFKQELIFRTPLMNAAGMLGFAPSRRTTLAGTALADWVELGAFVTNPISLRPRLPAAQPGLSFYPGGFCLHSGLPNPGLSAVIQKYARRWAEAALPVIVHLMADRPEETARMARRLEGLENIAALELGFAPQLADDILVLAVEMSLGELPLIVNLPFEQVLRLGPRLIQLGAAAISLAAPRGALPQPAGASSSVMSGRLYGPALFPQSYGLVLDVARLGLPILGGLGIYTQQQALAMLAGGALAVQLDTLLWKHAASL